MVKKKLLQYFSLVRYKAIKKVLSSNCKLILDMEDSAQNLFSQKKTDELKEICRKGIDYLQEKKINLNKNFIRINSINSKYFKKDIEVIKKNQKKGLKFKAIFLPKTESYNQILKLYKLLKTQIIPIIETNEGYKNLNKIIEKDNKNIIYGIHYGHFDYCLDKKIWPFPEPFHIEYWEIITPLIKICLKYKKKFIQTPYPLINNEKIFWSSFKYLERISKNSFLITLVNLNEKFQKTQKKILPLNLKRMSKNKQYSISFAKKVIQEYEINEKNKKSFSLTKKRFIPPHQYIMAKKYLKNEK